MTKKEWWNIKVSDRVQSKISEGVVIRFNSNHSQALIRWDSGIETWKGRLTIDKI
jgi:hypothetical protein